MEPSEHVLVVDSSYVVSVVISQAEKHKKKTSYSREGFNNKQRIFQQKLPESNILPNSIAHVSLLMWSHPLPPSTLPLPSEIPKLNAESTEALRSFKTLEQVLACFKSGQVWGHTPEQRVDLAMVFPRPPGIPSLWTSPRQTPSVSLYAWRASFS